MTEIYEFRINYDYASLLFNENEGKDLGQISKSVKVMHISKDDPRFFKIPIVAKEIEEKYGRGFFFGWEIKRKYTKREIDAAELFHFLIVKAFVPEGEQCGTVYDESVACGICGANAVQKGPLKLKKTQSPRKILQELFLEK